jgi:hypothetical protein
MSATATPPGWDHQRPGKSIPWRTLFRIIRWSTYLAGAFTLGLMLRKSPPPVVETSPQAAARAEQKLEQVEQAVSNGQPATMRMDQTELNSYLGSHLDIASNSSPGPTPAQVRPAAQSADARGTSATAASSGTPLELQPPAGTSAEQIEQVRSSVKDVKVELIEDRVRAYVVFDFHGKDMTLQLEGKLGAEDGYLHFEPVAGQIGSLPIPRSTLEAAVARMMESPENRERLKLPNDMSGLKIENGEVVATYK